MTIEQQIRKQNDTIGERAAALEERVAANGLTGRDIAELLELYALQEDVYESIQQACFDHTLNLNEEVLVKVDGKVIKFQNISDTAEWITNGLD